MQVDRKKFTEEGYNILPNVVPPDQLDSLRQNIEHMVNCRKEISAQQRTPHEPPGGSWQASAQPRLQFDRDCDARSSATIEFLLHENTLGVSKQLIKAKLVWYHTSLGVYAAEATMRAQCAGTVTLDKEIPPHSMV